MEKKRASTGQPGSSSNVVNHRTWLALWGTNTPGKALIHVWRLIKNGLAVGSGLLRRKIKPGIFCPACGREEMVYHRFWECHHSMLFWKELSSVLGARVAIPPRSMSTQSVVASWLLNWLSDASEDDRAAMVQGLYAIWLARNETREGK